MPIRFLTITLFLVALSGIASLISDYGQAESGRGLAASRPVSPVADTGSGDRIFLSQQQANETRDPTVWPVEMRSLLNVKHPLRYGEWRWDDHGVPPGEPAVRVDLGRQLISVERGGHEIGTAVILFGATGHETPLGRFPILSKTADYRSRAYDAPMPYAVRLTRDGVALHGSNVQEGTATHGCIGLPLAFARKLFNEVHKGDEVLIVRS